MSRTVALQLSLALGLGVPLQSAEPRSDAPIAWVGGAFNFNLAAGACELDARRIAVAVNVSWPLLREVGPTFRSDLKDRPLLGHLADVLFRVLDRETAEVLHEHSFGGGGLEYVLDMVSLGDGRIAACGSTTSPRLTDRSGWFHLAGGNDAWLAVIDLTGEAPTSLVTWGGSGEDVFTALAVRGSGKDLRLFVAGYTDSNELLGSQEPVIEGDAGASRTLHRSGIVVRAFDIAQGNPIAAGDIVLALPASPAKPAMPSLPLLCTDARSVTVAFTSTAPASGEGEPVRVGSGGGEDLAVIQWDAELQERRWSTRIGGAAREFVGGPLSFARRMLMVSPEQPEGYRGGILPDGAGGVFVACATESPDLAEALGTAALQEGVFCTRDALVVRLSDEGKVVAARLFGGDDDEAISALRGSGEDLLVCGWTRSHSFPDSQGVSRSYDGFVLELDVALGVKRRLRIAGTSQDIVTDALLVGDRLAVTGWSSSRTLLCGAASSPERSHWSRDAFFLLCDIE